MKKQSIFKRLASLLAVPLIGIALTLPLSFGAVAQSTEFSEGSPVFLGAFSRKVHGNAGTFDLPIDPAGSLVPGSEITVEPRSGGADGAFDVVFLFDRQMNSLNVALTGSGTLYEIWVNDNEVTTRLRNVPDGTRLGISLTVNGVAGAASANIGFLMGDVDGDGIVNQADVTLVSTRFGQPLSEDNFIYDVNASGIINQADVTAASLAMGNRFP